MVNVDLKDKRKFKGHIFNPSDTTFVVADTRTGTTTTVNYVDVKNVSRPISRWVELSIIVGLGVLLTRVKFRELP